MKNVSETKQEGYYQSEYIPVIYKWGMITNSIAIVLCFLPVIILSVVFKCTPSVSMIATGFASIFSVVFVSWIVDPITMYPILGMAGSFMSFLAGNISNLRLPCSVAAQKSAGYKAGTEEGNLVGTLGIAVSVVVNVIFVTLAVAGGSAILARLPQSVLDTLGYILPALFGAIFAQFAIQSPKLGGIAMAIALVLTLLVNSGTLSFFPGGNPTYLIPLGAIFGTMFIAKKITDVKQAD